ncbi:MAG: trigger factor, partial [Synergistota bacterium]|nr:trigger factor [Synergistota bacterium]
MTCTFENRPRVELPDLTELEVEKPVVAITEEMIDHAVERVREAHAERAPVSERPAAETDIVEIEYTLKSENESESGETPQTAAVDLTQSDARTEVRDVLLGANPGDEVFVEMTREPGAESSEDLVGFNIRVQQISEKKLPEMEKDLYQKVFGDEVETLESFREKVSERIQRQMEQEGRTISQRKAIDELVNRSELEVPETLIARAEANISRDIEEKIQKKYGKTVAEYLAEAGVEEEKHKSDIRESAIERVRRSLVLEALADEQSVEVANEDIDKEIASMAASMGLEKERIQQYLLGDQDRLGDLISRIRTDKTIEKLMAAVTVREAEASAEAEE